MTTVAHVILSNLDALGSRLPLVSDGDADGIHDARVATRRLRAALPLPDLTAERAAALVVEHLVNRTRSRRSRRRRQLHTGHDP